jgi:cyanophycin synthetase
MNTHVFVKSALIDDDLCRKAHEICKNKAETKKYLAKNNIPVPKGKQFDDSIPDEDILRYAESLGFPLVLKPTNGYQGLGVYSNIKNLKSLKESIDYVRHKLKFRDVILEERIEGDDFRISVIGGKVIASLKRIPPNITGDGINSIKKLIKDKNLARNKFIMLGKAPIVIDKEALAFIKSYGYNLNSVPPKGKRIFLNDKCNISTGGDPLDVTETIPQRLKDMAIKAIQSIPGLQHGGVDILCNTENPDGSCVVLEINSSAQIGGHLYPLKGKPRDVISELIDYYFPESIPNKGKNNNLFFDFDDVRNHLCDWSEFGSIINKDTYTEVTLTPPPDNKVISREIIVTGTVQKVGFRSWAKKQAEILGLFGFAENIKPDKMKIVVAGGEEKVMSLAELCKTGPPKARVVNIVIRETSKPVYLGFFIRPNLREYLRNEMKIALRLLKQRIIFFSKQEKIYTSDL